MATYRLKNFDNYLATTGFKCVMLTGSYDDGDPIEEDDENIKAVGIISFDSRANVVLGEYTFDKNGKCITPEFRSYKLMMAGTPREASDSEPLGAINETLAALNETIAAYLQQTENRIKALEDKAEDFEQRIEDLENK